VAKLGVEEGWWVLESWLAIWSRVGGLGRQGGDCGRCRVVGEVRGEMGQGKETWREEKGGWC